MKRKTFADYAKQAGFDWEEPPEIFFTPNRKQPKHKGPICIDLFAGCGGASLGMSRAGIHPAIAVDFDKWCMLTYMHNLGKKKSKPVCFIRKDIKQIKGKQLIKILEEMGYDTSTLIVWGSPPCQDFSPANMKNTKDRPITWDEGSRYCMLEFVRLIKEIKPLCFMMENVKGLVNRRLKVLFDEFLKRLKRAGYNINWKVLDAADFGVPQHRERVIAIGIHERQYNERKAQQLLQTLYPSCTVTPCKVKKR